MPVHVLARTLQSRTPSPCIHVVSIEIKVAHITWGGYRLLRLAGIRRRSQGDPFRFIDVVSDLRQEFSFSARRIVVAAFYIAVVVHWFACILWWTIRLQDYPAGKSVLRNKLPCCSSQGSCKSKLSCCSSQLICELCCSQKVKAITLMVCQSVMSILG